MFMVVWTTTNFVLIFNVFNTSLINETNGDDYFFGLKIYKGLKIRRKKNKED